MTMFRPEYYGRVRLRGLESRYFYAHYVPFTRGLREEEENVRTLSNFSVTISKGALLRVLQQNRAAHAAAFEEAFAGYKKACIVELEMRSKEIAGGIWEDASEDNHADWPRFPKLVPPANHTEVYDQLIGMLELATESEFSVSSGQYRCWVEDKWDWKEDFLKIHDSYTRY